jgi:hypothetical protein
MRSEKSIFPVSAELQVPQTNVLGILRKSLRLKTIQITGSPETYGMW